MKLQTNISLEKQSKNLIDYHSKVFLVGSCFSEHIAKTFNYFKFQQCHNPLGILFNPIAIERLIANAINEKKYTDKDVFQCNEQWHCFDAHSKLSDVSKEVLIDTLNSKLQETKTNIKQSSHVIITLGTSWVYKNKATASVVANCHKVPQKKFQKLLLSVDDIITALQNMVDEISCINKAANIIFTVSPVRHLKDGFIENTQSKAHLITAIHQFLNNKNFIENNRLYYFPSFEIMMDELRDYRFYAEDMIHPNTLAINYIWNKFKDVWVSDASFKTMVDIDKIQKGLLHRPFNPESQAHQAFLQKLTLEIKALQAQFPHIVF